MGEAVPAVAAIRVMPTSADSALALPRPLEEGVPVCRDDGAEGPGEEVAVGIEPRGVANDTLDLGKEGGCWREGAR